jgi:chromosome segregation ATPase
MSGSADDGNAVATGPNGYGFEVGDLDAPVRDILQVLDEDDDGEAHTTTLRKATGLTRGRLKYRMDKLEERGLVTQEKKRPDEGGQIRRHLALTETGRAALEDGLLRDLTDAAANVADLRLRVADVESRLADAASKDQARRYAEVRDDDLRRDLENRLEGVETTLSKTRRWVSAGEDRIANIESEVSTVDDRLADVATDTEARLDELEDAEAGRRLAELEERVATVESRLGELADRIEAVEGGGESRERDLQGLHERVNDDEERLVDLEAEVEELRTALEARDDDRNGLLPW